MLSFSISFIPLNYFFSLNKRLNLSNIFLSATVSEVHHEETHHFFITEDEPTTFKLWMLQYQIFSLLLSIWSYCRIFSKRQNTLHSVNLFLGCSNMKTEIWFLDRSLRWHFLVPTFTSYYRLMLLYLGLPQWQYIFTDIGLSMQVKVSHWTIYA